MVSLEELQSRFGEEIREKTFRDNRFIDVSWCSSRRTERAQS
ncbi:MAG: hypothetical protein ACO3FE_07505 [Planctomycetaceae bacterium]